MVSLRSLRCHGKDEPQKLESILRLVEAREPNRISKILRFFEELEIRDEPCRRLCREVSKQGFDKEVVRHLRRKIIEQHARISLFHAVRPEGGKRVGGRARSGRAG